MGCKRSVISVPPGLGYWACLKLTEEIGKWGGYITKAELPDYFEVDYVRVYELSE